MLTRKRRIQRIKLKAAFETFLYYHAFSADNKSLNLKTHTTAIFYQYQKSRLATSCYLNYQPIR